MTMAMCLVVADSSKMIQYGLFKKALKPTFWDDLNICKMGKLQHIEPGPLFIGINKKHRFFNHLPQIKPFSQ